MKLFENGLAKSGFSKQPGFCCRLLDNLYAPSRLRLSAACPPQEQEWPRLPPGHSGQSTCATDGWGASAIIALSALLSVLPAPSTGIASSRRTSSRCRTPRKPAACKKIKRMIRHEFRRCRLADPPADDRSPPMCPGRSCFEGPLIRELAAWVLDHTGTVLASEVPCPQGHASRRS